MKNWLTHWKTTAAGILSAFLGVVGPATSFLTAYDALIQQVPGHSHADFRVAIWGMGLTAGAAVARAWIGLLMHDSPPPPPPGQQPFTPAQLASMGVNVPPVNVTPPKS